MARENAGCGARILAVGGSMFMLVCGALIILERRAHETFEPVEATVTRLSTERYRDRRPDSHVFWYRPDIHFRYEVDGRQHIGRRFTFWPLSYIARESVERAMAPYESGETATAWYNPSNPHESMLARRASPIFYSAFLFGSAMVAFGLMGWSMPGKAEAGQYPRRSGNFYIAQPRARARLRLRDYAIGLVFWLGAGGILVIFHLTGPAPLALPPFMALLGTAFYLAVLPFGMYKAAGRFRSFQWLDDAAVWLTRERLQLGQKNPVLYVQQARRPLTIRRLQVSARLLCLVQEMEEQSDGSTRRRLRRNVLHETQQVLLENTPGLTNQPIRAEGVLALEPGLPPSSPPGMRTYPRYLWTIHARLEIEQGPVYEAEFPVMAE